MELQRIRIEISHVMIDSPISDCLFPRKPENYLDLYDHISFEYLDRTQGAEEIRDIEFSF